MTYQFSLMLGQVFFCMVLLFFASNLAAYFLPPLPFNSYWSRIVTGYALLLMGSGFLVRHDIAMELCCLVLVAWYVICIVLLRGVFKVCSKISTENSIDEKIYENSSFGGNRFFIFGCYAFIFTVLFSVFFFPEIATGFIVLQNKGPDLDGHLLSASYVLSGGTRSNLLSLMGPYLSKWNSLVNTWDYPDFIPAVAFEFLFRSNRVAYAGLILVLNQIFPIAPTEILLLSVMAFSAFLTSALIFEASLKRGFFTGLLLSLIFIFSQSLLIQKQEGIVAQLIALPLVTLFLLYLSQIKIKSYFAIILIGILLSTLMQTFGEGAQILGLISIIYVFILVIKLSYLKKIDEIRALFLSTGLLLITIILVDTSGFVDFLKWTLFRLGLGFSGGALHLDWKFLAVILNFPHARIAAIGDLHTVYLYWQTFLITAFLVVLLKPVKQDVRFAILLVVCFLASAIPMLVGHKYAYWKTIVIVSPFFLCYLGMLSPRFAYKNFDSKRFIILVLFFISFSGFYALSKDYIGFAIKINPPSRDMQKPQKEFAFVTLKNDGFVFHKYGLIGDLYWLNSGWGPNFRKYGKEDLPVYGLLDCINLPETCSKSNYGKRFYLELGKSVSDYLGADGKLNIGQAEEDFRRKLKSF